MKHHFTHRKFIVSVCFLFAALLCGLHAQTPAIQGYWQVVNQKSGAAESIVAVYPYQGQYFGRMVALYRSGKVSETLANPQTRAKGIEGTPYLCGLNFILNLHPVGNGRYQGSVIDPKSGSTYGCTVWFDAVRKRIAVYGHWFIFGRTEYWPALPLAEVPASAQFDFATYTPIIPP